MIPTYRRLLTEFVALKSVSTDPAFLPEIIKTADWLKQRFLEHGFDVELLTNPSCNPVVVARYDAGQTDTILVYGHYDVQPAAIDQGWSGDPFTLREADGRLYGRGVVDNKGQILAHIVTVFEHIKRNTLRANVTFMIEGNEETANPVLAEMVRANQKLLACSEIMVSDGDIVGSTPTLEASLRGGFNLRLQIRTARTDLHSGLAGGAVPSASTVLTQLLSRLLDASGKVLVPGFYDKLATPGDATLQAGAALQAAQDPLAHLGVAQLLSANDTDFYTQTGLYPTLQISGITSGYTGSGFANIVPATAEARLNVRTAPGQDSDAVATATERFIRAHAPEYATVEIETVDPHPAVTLATNTVAAERAKRLLNRAYGQPPIIKHVGGAIPIVADLKTIFKVDPLLVPFGNDDCNMHGANENFQLDLITKALSFSSEYFAKQ